ncbi:MAG TPA: energy transducer TonB [Longimicrobiales bacterium]
MKRRCARRGARRKRPILAGLVLGMVSLVTGACAGHAGFFSGPRIRCDLASAEREAAGGAPAAPEAQPDSAEDGRAAKPPTLTNREFVAEMARVRYLPYGERSRRAAAAVCAFVPENGIPSKIRLVESTGIEMLDSIAVQIGLAMRFEPALNRDGEPVAVWVWMPITFSAEQ